MRHLAQLPGTEVLWNHTVKALAQTDGEVARCGRHRGRRGGVRGRLGDRHRRRALDRAQARRAAVRRVHLARPVRRHQYRVSVPRLRLLQRQHGGRSGQLGGDRAARPREPVAADLRRGCRARRGLDPRAPARTVRGDPARSFGALPDRQLLALSRAPALRADLPRRPRAARGRRGACLQSVRRARPDRRGDRCRRAVRHARRGDPRARGRKRARFLCAGAPPRVPRGHLADVDQLQAPAVGAGPGAARGRQGGDVRRGRTRQRRRARLLARRADQGRGDPDRAATCGRYEPPRTSRGPRRRRRLALLCSARPRRPEPTIA